MRKLQNFVGGAYRDAEDGPERTPDRPQHRRGLCRGTRLGGSRHGPRPPGGGGRLHLLAAHHPLGAQPGPHPHRRRPRSSGRGPGPGRVREHRQALPADHGRGDPAHGRPDPLLCRRRPPPRGPGRGGVHGRAHLVRPPRAARRVRCGDAVELPDDDGGLEVRPGPGGGQHHGAQAVGHHARSRRCSWPRSWPSTCHPASSTSCAATATRGGPWSCTRRPPWCR